MLLGVVVELALAGSYVNPTLLGDFPDPGALWDAATGLYWVRARFTRCSLLSRSPGNLLPPPRHQAPSLSLSLFLSLSLSLSLSLCKFSTCG